MLPPEGTQLAAKIPISKDAPLGLEKDSQKNTCACGRHSMRES